MEVISCGKLGFVACDTPCGVGVVVLFPCGIGKRCVWVSLYAIKLYLSPRVQCNFSETSKDIYLHCCFVVLSL